MIFKMYLILFLLVPCTNGFAFEYKDYEHTFKEKLIDQSIVFGGHLTGYLLTQQKTIKKEGSFENMERNIFWRVLPVL